MLLPVSAHLALCSAGTIGRAGLGLATLEVGDSEVRHPDAAGAAVLLERLERLPRRDEVAGVQVGNGQWIKNRST